LQGPNRRQLSNLAEYGQVDGLGGDDGGELDADERYPSWLFFE